MPTRLELQRGNMLLEKGKISDSRRMIRVRAEYRAKGCKWVYLASLVFGTTTWAVKTFNGPHNCGRADLQTFMNSKWLSKEYMSHFKDNGRWDVNKFVEKVKEDHSVDVSRSKAYRNRKDAQEHIEGTYREQYSLLWDYVEEIKALNVRSTIEFQCDHAANGTPIFKRMYIAYAGCKAAFNDGCRKVIGLDGCHIKGPHTGQLLTAIGTNANNSLVPIAFAVVESECKDSWSWLMSILREDIHINNPHHWTFITDKQKGLTKALKEMWEGDVVAEHRHCARHLQSNFTKNFKRQILKRKMISHQYFVQP